MLNYLKIKFKILAGKEKIDKELLNKKNVYIFLAADYKNLGDVAITYAQKEYLKSVFNNANVIEIPLEKTLYYIKDIKKNIKKEDVITIVGGGNMGNIYEYYETLRRTVIKTFSNNRIITFPQTIDFSDDKVGRKSLEKTRKIINKHKSIMVLARERESYEKMKKYFRCNVKLIPDIVFSLKNIVKIKNVSEKRETIGICFRNDKEKNYKLKDIEKSITEALKDKKQVSFSTYLEDEEFIYETRYDKVSELLNRISTFNFIITDRLHAMIFAYLVNTPCYFLDNSNRKISNTYHTWLEKCESIFEVKEDNCNELINQMSETYDYKYDLNCGLEKEFTILKKELLDFCKIN